MTTTLIIAIIAVAWILTTWIKHRNIFKAYEHTLTGFSHDTNSTLLHYQDAQAFQSKYLSALLVFIADLILQGAIRVEDKKQKHNIAHFLRQLVDAMDSINFKVTDFYMITGSQALFIQENPQVVPFSFCIDFFQHQSILKLNHFVKVSLKNISANGFWNLNSIPHWYYLGQAMIGISNIEKKAL